MACSTAVLLLILTLVSVSLVSGDSNSLFSLFGDDSFVQWRRMLTPVPPGRAAKLSDLWLRHYGNDTKPTSSCRLSAASKILSDKFLILKNPTVVYAHGYIELVTDKSVQEVISAYIDSGGYNVLVLDWSNMAYGMYFNAALDVKAVGQELAKALMDLVKGGLSLDLLHLVGHSLGAHLMGFTAREMNRLGKRVSRLTGLDPAFPGFYKPLQIVAPISATDAEFVDVIHTDAGGFGTPLPTAQADFWPNGGRGKQPGCQTLTFPLTTEDFCSHWRSWQLWAESVRGGEFLARGCPSEDEFTRGKCKQNELVNMGVRAGPDVKGNFYLQTAAALPFALGVPGAE